MDKKREKKICIVTPMSIYSNPRVEKEADALWQAGYDVTVVFSQGNQLEVRQHDENVIKDKSWIGKPVRWAPFVKEEKWLYWKATMRNKLASSMPSPLWKVGKLPEYAEGRVYPELVKSAYLENADLYIGHYPAGLAAAAQAADLRKVKFGFDAEDLHEEEDWNHQDWLRHKRRIKLLQRRYLPGCSYLSAASEFIADELAKRYHVLRPLVLHNVFPWHTRELLDGLVKDRQGSRLSLYWFSQIIGYDRGIQDVIKAAEFLRGKVQIHLRGFVTQEIKSKLQALALRSNVKDHLYFHPVALSGELLSRAAEHDVGLALEPPVNLNRQCCVTNKIFYYFLSGLAVAATDTLGQKYIMSRSPNAGFVYSSGDHQALAAGLNRMIVDPEFLASCKNSALEEARVKWNWEKESEKLVEGIGRLFSS